MIERVLVTGGAGFIGAHLTQMLLCVGSEVMVIDNLSFGRVESLPPNHPRLTFLGCDIRDGISLERVCQAFRPDGVIHLAALHFIPYCNAHPLEAAQVNIVGSRNLLRCCEIVRPDVFFFASSAAVYAVGDEANAEDSLLEPTDIYGITKMAGEDLTKLLLHENGMRMVIGRLFNVYGPGETNPHVIPEIVEQLKSGKRQLQLGNIEPRRDFIHVTDVAKAICLLMEKFAGRCETFNIGSGYEYSIAQIVGFCEEIIGERITIEQCADRIRGVERMHLLADVSKIERTTGWRPEMDIKRGLAELLR